MDHDARTIFDNQVSTCVDVLFALTTTEQTACTPGKLEDSPEIKFNSKPFKRGALWAAAICQGLRHKVIRRVRPYRTLC